MQNRFTVKDFVYMLFASVICLLLWLNMYKTNREVNSLDQVGETLKQQQATLSNLADAIGKFEGGGASIDPAMLEAILKAAASGSSTPDVPVNTGGSRVDQVNLAAKPSFKPKYDIQQGSWTASVNLEGRPQRWQVSPDDELPGDFSAGDTIIQTWSSDAQSLTPLVSNDAYTRRIQWYTHEYLVHFDLDAPFDATPGLAREWDISEDGMTLTFRLFENATWSDGVPVTADDVIFTWDTTMNPKLETEHIRGYIKENVESWTKLDQYTVQFKMKTTYYDALGICSQLMVIIPQHIYGNYDEDTFNNDIQDVCIGSGPYILERWEKNTQIVLVRNENYWGAKPAISRIVTRIISNDLASLQEFRAENIDLLAPTSKQWTENKDADWFVEAGVTKNLYYTPRGGYMYIAYNLRKPHFSEKKTRQALTMLLDRQSIIDNLLDGMGRVVTGPFYFKADQYNHDIQPWPFDPDRAREQLAEIGWIDTDGDGIVDMDLDGDGIRDPFEVTYLAPSGSSGDTTEQIQRFVQDAFAKAGIKVNLDRLDWTIFLDRLNTRQYDMVMLSWTGGVEGDPYQIWHSASEANKGSNHVGFNNALADEMIIKGRTSMDYNQRMEYWHEFHRIVNEEQPYTFITARPGRSFVHGRFKNDPQRDYRLYYGEWYVPAADQIR